MPPKRAPPSSPTKDSKKAKTSAPAAPRIGVDAAETPFAALQRTLVQAASHAPRAAPEHPVVVYWSRNKDLRINDNKALASASELATRLGRPLVMLHGFSVGDYAAHDRSPRRIDFQLRALASIQAKLIPLNIPIYTTIWRERKQVPEEVAKLMLEWGATHLFANLEYEVDELGRDRKVVERVIRARQTGEGWDGKVEFLHDFCVIKPGRVLTQQGKDYSVFSPFYKNWSAQLLAAQQETLADAGELSPNTLDQAVHHPVLKLLLPSRVPVEIEGFTLTPEERTNMDHVWPVSEDIAEQVLGRFLKTKSRAQVFAEPSLFDGSEQVGLKDSKIGNYKEGRNRIDLDGTSHLSPYLAAGIISIRHVIRAARKLNNGKLSTEKDSSMGVFVSELAWRDFYQHVLAAWPRVCMGKAFNRKYDGVVWEVNGAHLEAWKEGKTGYPIVDAGMRALKEQGYMHNRLRMITAMFLTKDLMIDWREGERWFMQNLIDGDLASNNGGWQWSASTGTDPQPYFRVFNPLSQSTKSDPSAAYIRHFVPEIAKLSDKAVHNPSKEERRRCGYPVEIVDHGKARVRAIARFKEPGSAGDA